MSNLSKMVPHFASRRLTNAMCATNCAFCMCYFNCVYNTNHTCTRSHAPTRLLTVVLCVHVGYVLYRALVVHFNQACFISSEFVAIFSSPKLHPCQVHKVQRRFNMPSIIPRSFPVFKYRKTGSSLGTRLARLYFVYNI